MKSGTNPGAVAVGVSGRAIALNCMEPTKRWMIRRMRTLRGERRGESEMEMVAQVMGGTTRARRNASERGRELNRMSISSDSRRSRGIQCSVETSSGSSSTSGDVLVV